MHLLASIPEELAYKWKREYKKGKSSSCWYLLPFLPFVAGFCSRGPEGTFLGGGQSSQTSGQDLDVLCAAKGEAVAQWLLCSSGTWAMQRVVVNGDKPQNWTFAKIKHRQLHQGNGIVFPREEYSVTIQQHCQTHKAGAWGQLPSGNRSALYVHACICISNVTLHSFQPRRV